jgi:predicted glycogen debranching enzyme
MRGAESSDGADVRFEGADARDLEAGLGREWLLTNGLGGYASGTVPGVDTRQYHALLVAATAPPVGRMALLVRLNEAVTIDDDTTELMTSEYLDGTLFPEGYAHIESFALEDGLPTWTFKVGACLLRRTIWMVPGHNITVVRYKLAVGGESLDLALRPLCAARDHHVVQHGDWGWPWSVEPVKAGAVVRAGADLPALWLLAPDALFLPAGDWYWNFLLREERARGYEHVEDLFQPGTFHVTLRPGRSCTFIASAEEPGVDFPDPDGALAHRRSAHARIASVRPLGRPADHLAGALAEAADQFVVPRKPWAPIRARDTSLIAGYPWFADYTRDALIALPGIFLTFGRLADAVETLWAFADNLSGGLLPSDFPEDGSGPNYGAVDGSLLLFRALDHTLQAGAARTVLRDLYPILRQIIDCYQRGTDFGIGMDPVDGLLQAGELLEGNPPTHLTWMNASFGELVHSPRIGKPVEVNALWIESLDLMAAWAAEMSDDPERYQRLAAQAGASFAARFWYEEGGYLFDVVDGPEGNDTSLRPNQLFALAHRPALLSPRQSERALTVVEEHLLTPFGLRSLAPSDPRYIGRYYGNQHDRDRAYHHGTVWPWLLGSYVDAHYRVRGRLPDLDALLDPFVGHLREAGLGTVSEIFDGDAPHRPRGCIASAWSVGELARLARMAQNQGESA